MQLIVIVTSGGQFQRTD